MFTLALESGAEKGSSLGGKPKEQEEVRKMGEVRVLKTTQLATKKTNNAASFTHGAQSFLHTNR
jgi:hypothetical protein